MLTDLQLRLGRYVAGEPAEPPPRRSAVAAVLRWRSTTPEVLLMRRAEHELDPWSGQVSLPGGRHEPADQDLLATAVRETREEVQLDLAAHATLLCRLDPVRARARGRLIDMDVTPFVFRLEQAPEPQPGPEASEVFWLPLLRVATGELDGEYTYRRGETVHRLPCWRYGERVVWGLTHRMLSRLLEIGAGG